MTTRAQVILVAAVVALVGAVDFIQRIHVPRTPAARDPIIGMTALPDRPLPLASARERLQSWFPAQTTGQQVLPADAPAEPRDSGGNTPDRADLGGWRFVLRGVFDAGPPFAVLDVMPSTGGETEQHRLSAGDTIKGVRLERITGRRVSLSDGQTVIQLALFIDPEDDMTSIKENDE